MLNRSFIRLKEISKMTNISTATLRKYAKVGLLRAVKIGGNYYSTILDYEKFIYTLYNNKPLESDPDKFSDALGKLRDEDKSKVMDHSYNHYNSRLK